jgi:uncharacterized protein YbbC (DUF1343 family)
LKHYIFLYILVSIVSSCSARETSSKLVKDPELIRIPSKLILGCENINDYWYLIDNKNVALVVNQTSVFSNKTHIVDSFIRQNIQIKKIFAPEHGFRGTADAGASISNQIDTKTGIPIISLYGSKVKPSKEDLAGIEVVVFDIQDVGARFYTYISTMYYVMQACAENKIKIVILDRPNPNGYYVDGPVLDIKYKSFVGKLPIPIVHGCTIGELAHMINEEGWLGADLKCELTVSSCKNYMHRMQYSLPINPSPNLRTDRAIMLYPSLCMFEATEVSVARGTDFPFEAIGSPFALKSKTDYSFMPKSRPGATSPPFKDKICYGYNLRLDEFTEDVSYGTINLSYLIRMYNAFGENKLKFFHTDGFFEKLAGNDELKEQIIQGLSEKEIKATWQEELSMYKEMRKKYLLYPDFE